ncbi:MAG: amino acid adenylation domain-containing protein, partial [Saprospiraceae bacterium]
QHDALRFKYTKPTTDEGQWEQTYGSEEAILEIVDLTKVNAKKISAKITETCQRYQESLDIEKGELIKVVLMKTPDSLTHDRLFFVIHHLAIDEVSWRIISDQFIDLVDAISVGKKPALPAKTSSYRQWGQALMDHAVSKQVTNQLPYWQMLGKGHQTLPLEEVTAQEKVEAKVHFVELEASLTQKLLQEVNSVYNTDINDFLLGALAKTISTWSKNDKVLIGREGHGREHISPEIDLTSTVGWFTNLYPVALEVTPDLEKGDLIKSVKEQLRSIPNKGMGFGLLRYLHPSENVRESLAGIQWDIIFNYLGQQSEGTTEEEQGWLFGAAESIGTNVGEGFPRYKLEINTSISGGKLGMFWGYQDQGKNAETIVELATAFLETITTLIDHCVEKETSEKTAFDYGLSPEISYKELDNFLAVEENGVPRRTLIDSLYRLSPMQEGMLFHYLYEKGSLAYTEQLAVDFTNGMEIAAFKTAWEYVMANHTIMRTKFFGDQMSIPVQAAYKTLALPFEFYDFSKEDETTRNTKWAAYKAADLAKGIDFDEAPLFRIALIKMTEEHYIMLWTFHHILFDGWSNPILIEELLSAYEALISGGKVENLKTLVPVKEDRFEDYIKYIGKRDKLTEEQFWQDYLSGFESATLLPFIGESLGRNKGGTTKSLAFGYDEQLTEKIKRYTQTNQITVNTFIQGVWGFLLSKYTGNTDVIFGVTVSGRPSDLADTEQRIGLFINAIPARMNIETSAPIAATFASLQKGHTTAREYQYTALNDIQRWIQLNGEFFDSLITFENYPLGDVVGKEWSLEVGNIEMEEQTNYLLSIAVNLDLELNINFRYNVDLLSEAYAEMIKTHFLLVIDQLVLENKTDFATIELVTPEEQQLLLETFNDTAVPYAKDKSLIGFFEAQVEKTPTKTAMIFQGETLTYTELNERANQLAACLLARGVQVQDKVGILSYRGFDMIVSLLATLKCGAIYVPLNIDYPKSRLAYILDDAGAKHLIYDQEQLLAKTGLTDYEFIAVAEGANYPTTAITIPTELKLTSGAYVMYTSGTTGEPKGILVNQDNILKLCFETGAIAIYPEDRVLQWSNFSFDGCTYEIFGSLLNGASLCMISEKEAQDPESLARVIRQEQLTVNFMTTALFNAFVDQDLAALNELRIVLFGGELVSVPHVKTALATLGAGKIIHVYGPTETTTYASYYPIEHCKEDRVPIGKPLSNTQLYILDAEGQLAGVGMTGEIYIGGAGVSMGYLNRPEMTADKFVVDKFSGISGAKLYRTGDLGFWLPEGNIEFIGRKDLQVKVRGYRIELGAIETKLQESDWVNNCVVLAKADPAGTKRLIAYVIPNGTYQKEEILNYLKAELPEYMVPSIMMELATFPLNANGKVDKKALPEPDLGALLSEAYVAPRNEMETNLTKIWEQILNLERVGVYDNFFDLGGHSLLATRTVSAIRKQLDLEMSIKDLFVHANVAALAEFLLLNGASVVLPAITLQERPEHIPLSFAQERLWFIDKLEGSTHYHIPSIRRFGADLNIDSLQYALSEIVNRHEVLRTVFKEENELAFQHFLPENTWTLAYEERPDLQAEEKLSLAISEEVGTPFDLSKDHMLRAKLFKLSATSYVLVVTLHHIAFDGWSNPILFSELEELYNAKENGSVSNLRPLTIQYADYALWQRAYLQGEVLAKKMQYWKDKLGGLEALDLPTDFVRPAIQSTKGSRLGFNVDEKVFRGLQALAQQEGVTIFMMLLAAFKVFLYKYSGQNDIAVGIPIANRTQSEVESMVGFFVNTLTLRSDLEGNPSFADFLKDVKHTTLSAYNFQDVPFEKIVNEIVTDRDLSRTPLFQVMFSFENYGEDVNTAPEENVEVPSTEASTSDIAKDEDFEYENVKYDLSFNLSKEQNHLEISIEYCSDLFLPETVVSMQAHFEELLSSIVATPTNSIDRLNMINEAEKQTLLGTFNDHESAYPQEKTVIALFEERAQICPDQIAITFEGEALSYQSLNERSNQFARYLVGQGFGEKDFIAICIDRSFEMIIAMLAIQKLGISFIPIDPEYPQERIDYILEDSKAEVIVSTKKLQGVLAKVNGITAVLLDEVSEEIQKESTEGFPLVSTPEDVIYVIYTSGSTGKPKGILNKNRGMVNFLWSMLEILIEEPKEKFDNFLAISSYSFDISYLEIYLPLIMGAKVILATRETAMDGFLLQKLLKETKPNFMQATPSTWQLLLDSGWKNEEELVIISGAEPMREKMKRSLIGLSDKNVWNLYGPTETTVWATAKKLELEEKVNIGKPISNVEVYILKTETDTLTLTKDDLVPIGGVGELCIGGVGLAVGYLNREVLTAEKFVQNPFSDDETNLIYRTGDLARWLNNGELECLGRMDDQVKIRGHRIELGEIETVLQKYPIVKESIVVAQEDAMGTQRLAAYLTATVEFDQEAKEGLQSYLKASLPGYMVPRLIAALDALPLTPNGKINKKALPEIDASDLLDNTYEAPRNDLERSLAKIWGRLLGIEEVGVYDNFFELGGHSLLATRVISAIRKELGVELSIQGLFRNATIALLASYLTQEGEASSLPAISAMPRPAQIPLSFAQERLWFIDKLEGSIHYHMPLVQRIEGEVDQELLAYTFNEIVNRHEVLRTVYREEEDFVYQEILPKDAWDLKYEEQLDLGEEAIEQLIEEELTTPFDLANDYMLRASLIKVSDQEYLIILILHHIASDAWSEKILFEELSEIYNAREANRAPALSPLTIQYADYALWQRAYLSGEILDRKLQYWEDKLKGVEVLNLPTDFIRPMVQSTKGRMLQFNLDKNLSEKLERLARKEDVTIFMLLLSAFKVLLLKYTGQEDIAVGTTIANRTQAEMESLIGFFINTLTLRSNLSGDPSFKSLIDQVKTTTLASYDHQDVPFEKIVERVVEGRDLSRTPLFQVVFSYINNDEMGSTDLLSELGRTEAGEATTTSDEPTVGADTFEQDTAKFELSIDVGESEDGLVLGVEYCTDLFLAETIERMMKHYETLLFSILENPNQQLSQISMLPAEEKALMLGLVPTKDGDWFNEGEKDLGNDLPINVRFEAIAAQYPNDVAIVHQTERWTYQQTNDYANQVAHTLQAQGLETGDFVGVYLDRNPKLVSSILGILKAGAVYVPLDTQNPIERIEKMIEGGSMKCLITESNLLVALENISVSNILLIDESSEEVVEKLTSYPALVISDQQTIATQQTTNIPNQNDIRSWAYLLYTSGSTGTPKGAITRHDGAMNHILVEFQDLELRDGFGFLQSAGIGSDISMWQILGPLLKAGTVVIIDKYDLLSYESVLKIIENEAIDIIEFVPSYAWGLLECAKGLAKAPDLSKLQWIMLVGEAVPVKLVNEWGSYFPQVRVLNGYGPCEASDDITQYEIIGELDPNLQRVPIGRSITNMNMFVLDASGNLCPIGVAGELCVSGVGVGAGYWQDPEKTAASFVPNPFPETLGDILYKTGDLGRWLPDGNLEFLGRIDRQIKIRGHRVELGEIETVIREDHQIKEVHISVDKASVQDARLVAFIIPESLTETTDQNITLEQRQIIEERLIQLCQQTLPVHMRPSFYCFIEEMPVNLSDKVDDKALLKFFAAEDRAGVSIEKVIVAPRNAIEENLLEIWRKILRVETISIYADFFELGGHSLLATRVVSAIRKKMAKEVAIKDVFVYPTIAGLAAVIAEESGDLFLPEITTQERPERIPLSFAQERLWFIDRLEGSTNYNMPMLQYFGADLDKEALTYAIQQVINRHDVLRTVFEEEEGQLYQVVMPKDQWELGYEGALNFENKEALDTYVEEEITKAFDLATDYMLRAKVLKLKDETHLLVMTLHHIASDGWSESILFEELAELYQAKKNNRAANLQPLPLQYIDYALWQRKYLDAEVLGTKLQYWEDKLADVEALNLVTDFVRPPMQSIQGNNFFFKIDQETSIQLEALAKKQGVTMFMLTLSAFKVLMHKYAGQEDITIGTPIANRTQEDIEQLIGMFVNTLTLRSDLSGNPRFVDFLEQVKHTTLEAYENQEVPFERIVDRVVSQRDLSRSPLFQVMFSLEDKSEVSTVNFSEEANQDEALSVVAEEESDELAFKLTKFDITLNLERTKNGFDVVFSYCTDLFLPETIKRMIAHFNQLLTEIITNPTAQIASLELLTAAEEKQLTQGFNPPATAYPREASLVSLFEEQVVAYPARTAVYFGDRSLSYQDLDQRSNQLAHRLQAEGVVAGDLVCLLLDRSELMLVAMLGIMKAGAAYVPMAPEYPTQRIEYLLGDTQAKLVITEETYLAVFAEQENLATILIEAEANFTDFSTEPLAVKPKAEDLAYVIYTSGSTGKPKGVLIEHRSVINELSYCTALFDVSEEDRHLLLANYVFDASIEQIFVPLLNGASVEIAAKETMLNVGDLESFLDEKGITHIHATPSFLQTITPRAYAKLKRVCAGGELCSPVLAQSWSEHVRFFNEYGPTETTVTSTCYEYNIPQAENVVLPIGKPIANTQVYILDQYQALVPLGVAGELCIGGDGLARAYLNRPALTAEKFISNPFSDDPTARLYRTGDLARWLPDGNLSYLGRLDDQVKIRGYRIELGEIDNVLENCPLVQQNITIVDVDATGEKRLVSYVVPEGEFDKTGIQAFLRAVLPEYMIPSLFIALTEMPLTANGKVNQKALPSPDPSGMIATEYVAPRNEMEERIVKIWKVLLGVEKIGVFDNFFDLGGHSILAIKLVALLKKELSLTIPMKVIFQYTNIADFVEYINLIQLGNVADTEEDDDSDIFEL